jgi:heat shock protein HslJ
MEGVWVLREMRLAGADAFVPGDSSRFTVEFAPDGGMGVVADCNQCGGTYTLDGEALVVPDLVCTLVLCPTPGPAVRDPARGDVLRSRRRTACSRSSPTRAS